MPKPLFSVFVFCCLFVVSCASVPVTGRKQISLVSNSEITALSNEEYKDILSQSKIETGTANARMVQEVGQKIARAAEQFLTENGQKNQLSDYNWEFNLIKEDNTVNAFCMPGGKIVVYTGILPYTKNADGLAVVIGHEVAHAIANHGAERMSQNILVGIGGNILGAATKNQSDQTKQLFGMAYGVGSQVGVLLPYSRSHESEADRIGLILTARAGYNPNYAVAFWTDMSEKSNNSSFDLLSTHPSASKRISDIKKYLPEALQYYKK